MTHLDDEKKIYFLCGLPRAGNTLLGSILNQNKDITLTANSITPNILTSLTDIKNTSSFLNFPDHNSINNVIQNIFINYYKNWNSTHIIDRGPWGTIDNLNGLKTYFNKQPKFIILLRDVFEVLGSFLYHAKHNKNFVFNKMKTNEKICEELLEPEGMIIKELRAIKNLLNSNEKYFVIWYDDLVEKTESVIKNLYTFLEIPQYNHNFNNIQNFTANNLNYDDTVLGSQLHQVRLGKINKRHYDYKSLIPEHIYSKYKDLNFFKP